MRYTRLRVITAELSDFLRINKKLVICFLSVFAAGLIVGIVATINSYGGTFERISRSDVDFGAVKVFFFSILILAGGYLVLLISASNPKLIFIAIVPYVALGVFMGKYVCLLIARYASLGLLNLFLIYLPFFLLTFVCMLAGGVTALNFVGCESEGRFRLRPPFVRLLKAYGVNVACCFLIFLIIGSMTGVIIVSG